MEKARAYLKQVLQDQQLNVPSEGHEGTRNPSPQFWARAECTISPTAEDQSVSKAASILFIVHNARDTLM